MKFEKIGDMEYMEHLCIEFYDEKPKTRVYRIFSRHDQCVLGIIKWSNHWRRYVYDTDSENVIWSEECLLDLIKFITYLMDDLNTSNVQIANKGGDNV